MSTSPKKTGKQLMAGRGQAPDADRSRLQWWREARFGMFIHWGLYAIPAGFWKGERVRGIGEWIMYNAKIPAVEYEKLAASFNPVKFDAERWVSLAKRAGMRYIVITAKHHDGFALFSSPCDSYNVVDATPFKRDIMAELAAACQKAGIRLCFYYSQDQDWHDPDGAWNDWDFDESAKDFDRYFRRKCLPQVTELLTQYGPIGLIWFDTPYTIGANHSKELRDLVHRLQPDCLVNGRVGNDLGDYGSLGDNQIPVGRINGDYETPATMNDTWGFRSDDSNWKSVDTLLHLLIDLASKGINYLLNVGPTAEGEIPAASVERLETIGNWLAVNGEAVYGTAASPYPYELTWGRMTTRGNQLNLIFFEWPRESFVLYGLANKVTRAYLLADRTRAISVTQSHDSTLGHDVLTLNGIGHAPSAKFPVVVLELDGAPKVDESPMQQPNGTVLLPSFMAEIKNGANGTIEVSRPGFTDEWRDSESSVSWTFKLVKPGVFRVRVTSAAPRKAETRRDVGAQTQAGPHRIRIVASGGGLSREVALPVALTPDEQITTPRTRHFPETATNAGTLELPKAGVYTITVHADAIDPASETGIAISGVQLLSQ